MRIQFYDDPVWELRSREEVRFNQLGLYMHEDGRRFSVGFDITPFKERPSIQVFAADVAGKEISSMRVIETNQPNFNLTMHLPEAIEQKEVFVTAVLYYADVNARPLVVDKISAELDISKPGEQH